MTIEMQTLSLKLAATEADRQHAIDLLQQHNLPVADINGDMLLYLLSDDHNQAIGTAGLEIFEDCGLLRSVSVTSEARGSGVGKLIISQVEAIAKESGITCLFLLTTTAAGFFQKLSYAVVSRSDVPEAIKQTTEFASLCPASAIVMKKIL